MATTNQYAIGLDYGTNSVRCLVVRCADGAEIGTHVHPYEHGEAGIILDPKIPDLARQHPADYLSGAVESVRKALEQARQADPDFAPEKVVGIGVDTTGSTPMPVDDSGRPLAEDPRFADNPNAMAWLWKDHTSTAEAAQITERADEEHPEYLRKCGGVYSSEWFWSKIWHCINVAPEVVDAAATWIEIADWIPGVLTGKPHHPIRGICAAGHKAMYHPEWGGYPDREFLAALHPKLGAVRDTLNDAEVAAVDHQAGDLTEEWAQKLGLKPGIPVAVGAFDAHLGAVGSGVRPGVLVKIIGTSTCDITVAPLSPELPYIPGLCGVVPGSVLPGYYGLEAGQSAVGDIFNWWVNVIKPAGATHESLTEGAARLRPGESGLLALDWNNGNRTVLVDQRLTGLLVGQTLQTRPEEVYRALIEATAFGARVIIERFLEFGIAVNEVVNCGGIAEKNPVVMQIYADIIGRPMKVSRSAQTCALGSAIAAAVVAGVYPDFAAAQKAMTGVKDTVYTPQPEAGAVYNRLFKLYRDLHDALGTDYWTGNLGHVMKELLNIRDEVRGG